MLEAMWTRVVDVGGDVDEGCGCWLEERWTAVRCRRGVGDVGCDVDEGLWMLEAMWKRVGDVDVDFGCVVDECL